MAVPTSTYQAVSAINFEDMEDTVYAIDPDETPLMSMIGRTRVKALKH